MAVYPDICGLERKKEISVDVNPDLVIIFPQNAAYVFAAAERDHGTM